MATLRRLDSSRLITDASGWRLGGVAKPTADVDRRRDPGGDGSCGAGVDCGDAIDVHAYPGPWPRPRVRRRWFADGAWGTLRWLRDASRASVLGEFGGVRYEVAGQTSGPFGWGYGQTAPPVDCAALAEAVALLWRQVGNMSGLAACVYTQLTDVEAEWNGLLTYGRMPKCPELLPARLAAEIRAVRQKLSSVP